jgi:hypothetical protein
MRINHWWRPWKWLPVFLAMPKMIVELMKDPSRGLLGRPRTFLAGRTLLVLQYWASFEQLERYSRDADAQHLPAWRAFNRRIRDNGAVGIYHETYRIAAGDAETVYGNMPVFGLAGAVGSVPARQAGESAARRMGTRPDDEPPVQPY